MVRALMPCAKGGASGCWRNAGLPQEGGHRDGHWDLTPRGGEGSPETLQGAGGSGLAQPTLAPCAQVWLLFPRIPDEVPKEVQPVYLDRVSHHPCAPFLSSGLSSSTLVSTVIPK